MSQTERILFEQLKRHATHYIESSERGIVVDDLDVDSFIEETSKLVTANEANLKTSNCNIPHVVPKSEPLLPKQLTSDELKKIRRENYRTDFGKIFRR